MARGINPYFNPTRVEEYISPLATIAVSTMLSFNHGLSKAPSDIALVLTCVTAEHGYSVGDTLRVGTYSRSHTVSSQDVGATLSADATSVYIATAIGGAGSVFFEYRKDGAGISVLTNASWRMHVVARVYSIGDVPDISRVGEVPLSEGTIFQQPSLGIALPPGYTSYELDVGYIAPVTTTVFLSLRTGTDGATADTGASDYSTTRMGVQPASTVFGSANNGQSSMEIANGVGAGTGFSGALKLHILHPSLLQRSRILGQFFYLSDASKTQQMSFAGDRKEDAAINYLELYYSSGNIKEAHYTLYGRKAPA